MLLIFTLYSHITEFINWFFSDHFRYSLKPFSYIEIVSSFLENIDYFKKFSPKQIVDCFISAPICSVVLSTYKNCYLKLLFQIFFPQFYVYYHIITCCSKMQIILTFQERLSRFIISYLHSLYSRTFDNYHFSSFSIYAKS